MGIPNSYLPNDISFEEWIDYVFDHEDTEWHWALDAPFWDSEANSALAVAHMSRLFSNSKFLIDKFSKEQIGTGINYVVNNACSNHMFSLLDSSVPIMDRKACIESIPVLYRDLFSQICHQKGQLKARVKRPEDTQAEFICFMFWDVVPLWGRSSAPFWKRRDADKVHDHQIISMACLDAMDRTLAIRSSDTIVLG